MELRDLLVTPIVISIIYVVAYIIRPRVTDGINRVYFFPALTLKIFGALALGFLYQFYYDGGDTFNYHTHGSRYIWEAFMDSPDKGLRLIFLGNNYDPGIFKYASKIIFFSDPSSYFVIRIAALFDLFTFSSYSATSVLFAVFSFIGSWMLFLTFYGDKPHLHRLIALATLFIPSVVIWGSGLLKDTITFACLGISTFLVREIFIKREFKFQKIALLFLFVFIIFSVKKYILLCYLPAAMIWVFISNLSEVRSLAVKLLLLPFVLVLIIVSGYFAILRIGENDPRYSLDKLAVTAKITAYDIGFYTGRDAGSTYTLGELDDSFLGLVKLSPQAINVSLFRPFLWEVQNPLMLLSALESFCILILTLYVLMKSKFEIFNALLNPPILFCLVFSITFAFAVGISTFNFGTLSRYKIPLLPFYLVALIFTLDHVNNERKFSELEVTE